MDNKQLAEQIHARFLELNVEVPVFEIENRLDALINEFKVPADEAKRSVTNYFLKQHRGPRERSGTSSEGTYAKISDVNDQERWLNLKVKVVQLWEPNSPSIAQVGLLGDESGTIKFTNWANAQLSLLEEGKSYAIRNVVTKLWQGRFSVSFNKMTEIAPLDEEVTVVRAEEHLTGVIIDVQSGSGLIKRCPDCGRLVIKGSCPEHGKVESIYDLRIKAVLDDGDEVHDILFNCDLTEKLTGITLETAKDMAIDALDQNIVSDTITDMIVGRYYSIRGTKTPRWILVTGFEELLDVDEGEVDFALKRARGGAVNVDKAA
ncbi:MAG: replication factor A [Halobacteriota archaeon]